MTPSDTRPPAQLDVVVVGLNVVDVLLRTPPVVARGAKHEIQDVVVQGGAPAGNAACLLARLGWRTGFVARLGDDAVAQIARHEFRRYGVSEALLIDDPAARPALAIVEIDPHDGERTVFYTLTGYRWLAETDVCRETIAAARLVLVDGYEVVGARTALQYAEAAGLHRVVDLEAGDPQQLHELLALATDAILPLAAAERLAAFRAETAKRDGSELVDLSFDTISAAGGHAAIPHYRVTTATNLAIPPDSLFLIDSGGQYPDGTTDVTRTVPIGTPTACCRPTKRTCWCAKRRRSTGCSASRRRPMPPRA